MMDSFVCNPDLYDLPTLVGKVCMVTGATAGIGKVTATALAAMGAHLVITGRNFQKTKESANQIISETGNKSVDYLIADYADLQQVTDLAAEFKSRYSRLDVLVNNAGAFFNTRKLSTTGVEMTFLVNHLAPFLVTNLLMENIQNGEPARIVNVSSDAHKLGSIDFDDLGFNKGYFGMKAYGRSKLANILFTYELARRLKDSNVTVNVLHPGHVASDIWKTNFNIIGPLLKWFMGLIALTPEEGADNSIYLATSPELEGTTGKYFVKRESVASSPISYDEKLAQKLWDVSNKLTKLK
jgi:NAD(P)-dependent dehydrogenase (short-subunit alcohol dehydrogenase family)